MAPMGWEGDWRLLVTGKQKQTSARLLVPRLIWQRAVDFSN